MTFPGDRFAQHFDAAYFRGVTIHARPEVIFRWLCQMRVAPYSYDWIDNLGRRSPRTLTPGLDQLAIGQRFLSGLGLIDFDCGRHLTVQVRPKTVDSRLLGDLVITYFIKPQPSQTCRLLVKFRARYRKGPIGWVVRLLLPWADLIMMRRQLLNFKRLSEGMPNNQ